MKKLTKPFGRCGELLKRTADWDRTYSFHILSNSLCTNDPIIGRCMICDIGTDVKRTGNNEITQINRTLFQASAGKGQ
jgi:hypothetical protein